ncbi:TSUP family transporter [Caldivirga sp.]|uniref:TSUP family transporter n=1 Tax=Caldivirga sp. TaxID=2080243 RepID=UPI003D148275
MIEGLLVLIKFMEILLAGLCAGILGSLAGLGGGVVLTPVLTLFIGIPMMYASGSALISTIATSAGSASVYIKRKLANDRIGISLVTATTGGAIVGSLTANYVYQHELTWIIYTIFGVILLFSIIPTIQRSTCELPPLRNPDKSTRLLRLYGVCYDPALKIWYKYWGVRWWLGELIMFFAGFISGLLGIGSGALKVLGMDWAMNLPMKVSTTTSNFMIGVTAATSSSLYWHFGYIQPFVAVAAAMGVLAGSSMGTRLLIHITNRQIRWVFVTILAYFGLRMVLRGLNREHLLPLTSPERNVIAIVFSIIVISTLYLIITHRYSSETDETVIMYRTQPSGTNPVEERFINITSSLLKYGVLVSVSLMGIGLLIMVVTGSGLHYSISMITDPSSQLNTSLIGVFTIISGLIRLDGLCVMLTGLLALIAIPILMVVLNMVRFMLEHDMLYLAFTIVVIINLSLAVFVLPLFIS